MQRSTFIGFAVTASALAALTMQRPGAFGSAGAKPEDGTHKLSHHAPSQAGRCISSRKTSRWSGFTSAELDA